jgi:two-component system phosphate regulon sensor histidine kinase PhoR
MQAILDNAGDGIVITDLNWRIEYINPAQEHMLGYQASDLRGQTTGVWASRETPREVYEDMESTLQRGERWQGEVRNQRTDGSLVDVALIITPLRDAAGQVSGYVGIHHDISRLKEIEQLKSKFVSDVSHELRTPVTSLKLYVELLERGKSEKRAQYMSTLKEQANRLVQLVEDILNLSRLELGAGKAQFVAVDLNTIVREVIDTHMPIAMSAGLALTFTLEPTLPPVWGEPNQLAQVVTNLVANAIRYSRAGQVQVSSQLRDEQVCLEVRDEGMGIHAEDLPHLFERFYRGKQTADQAPVSGTGLGLAIVKEIVDLHQGDITVTSQVGAGTIFRVCLPLIPPAESDAL